MGLWSIEYPTAVGISTDGSFHSFSVIWVHEQCRSLELRNWQLKGNESISIQMIAHERRCSTVICKFIESFSSNPADNTNKSGHMSPFLSCTNYENECLLSYWKYCILESSFVLNILCLSWFSSNPSNDTNTCHSQWPFLSCTSKNEFFQIKYRFLHLFTFTVCWECSGNFTFMQLFILHDVVVMGSSSWTKSVSYGM